MVVQRTISERHQVRFVYRDSWPPGLRFPLSAFVAKLQDTGRQHGHCEVHFVGVDAVMVMIGNTEGFRGYEIHHENPGSRDANQFTQGLKVVISTDLMQDRPTDNQFERVRLERQAVSGCCLEREASVAAMVRAQRVNRLLIGFHSHRTLRVQ